MSWPITVLYALAAVGAVGFCLMMAAFVMIAVQGGWQKAIQQPIAQGRWPLPRRVLMVGASLGLFSLISLTVLRMIPVETPSNAQPATGQSTIHQTDPVPSDNVKSQPTERLTRPRNGGQLAE